MLYKIKKQCLLESIIYTRVDDEQVRKSYYDENGNKKKEKVINVRKIIQHRRSHRNTQDFLEDMMLNYGYLEIM